MQGNEASPKVEAPVDFRAEVFKLPSDRRNPNPWLALYLDQSVPLDEQAKAALVLDTQSFSRRVLLPVVFRPIARLSMGLIQVLKLFMPKWMTSAKVLHRMISWGMGMWVSPAANYLILRHFFVGSEIVGFIKANLPFAVETDPIRPSNIVDVRDEIFLRHDINLFNFVIDLNRIYMERGERFTPPKTVNFDAITDGQFPIQNLPNRWTNFIDAASAIEIYTPLYHLFLTDEDFWRASNSLQLDETVAMYVGGILRDGTHLGLVNNKHPLVPLTTLRAGFRLLIHGLAAESLHMLLRLSKRQSAAGATEFGLRKLMGG